MTRFSKFDMKMFNKAREIAKTSDFDHFHLGCILVYKHRILAAASNTNKTHPQQKYYNQFMKNIKENPQNKLIIFV